ncbi:MAG: hypothetical protein J6Z45_04960 [Oscillospiraceae bacterium]|nr:hypothetical protein [Oscillospiraceae bacterium]
MEQIEWLRLSRCEITDNTFLSRFPNLRILHLNDCRYDRAALRYAPDLTELSVSFRNPGDEQVLAELKHLKKLSLGNISDCSVLTKLPELESLELIFCDQVSDFSCLAQIPTLKRLIIFGTDEQKDFDFLKTMTQLELLGVESKHFNFKDAMALQEKLPNCRIETHDYDDDF